MLHEDQFPCFLGSYSCALMAKAQRLLVIYFCLYFVIKCICEIGCAYFALKDSPWILPAFICLFCCLKKCQMFHLADHLWNMDESSSGTLLYSPANDITPFQASKCIICENSKRCSVTSTTNGRTKIIEAASIIKT